MTTTLKGLYNKLMTCRRCQIVAVAFLALVIGLAIFYYFSGSGANGLLQSIALGSGSLFDAFWQTAGREESRNRLDSWRADDVGSGSSVGWLHFNQSHSIHLLMQEAYADNPTLFENTFGGMATSLRDSSWIKSANLNTPVVQDVLLKWLSSPWGEKIQKLAAKKYYFDPTMQMIDRVRPSASPEYRVVAASTRVWTNMGRVEQAVRDFESAEAFTAHFRNTVGGDIGRYRFTRQLANARSTIAGRGLEIA